MKLREKIEIELRDKTPGYRPELVDEILQAVQDEKIRIIDELVEKAQVKCMTMEVGSIDLSDLEAIAAEMKK